MVANIITKSLKKRIKPSDEVIQVSGAKTFVKGSVIKVNRVLNIIRGASVKDAMNYLYFSPYSCASDIAKLVKSAIANAYNSGLVKDINELIISQIWSSQSLEFKRMKAASKGRSSPRTKRHAFITVELASILTDEFMEKISEASSKELSE